MGEHSHQGTGRAATIAAFSHLVRAMGAPLPKHRGSRPSGLAELEQAVCTLRDPDGMANAVLEAYHAALQPLVPLTVSAFSPCG